VGLRARTLEGLTVTPGFWKDKRVLLTGHTGFKGSWLALWLQQLGARVTGLALPVPTEPAMFEAAGVAKGMTSLLGDIREIGTVDAAVAAHRPEIVLHLAAQALVRASYADPVGTYGTNVMGTVHVLDAVRRAGGARVVLVVTSDKCYRNREWPWGYRESDEVGGRDPYSNSKSCAELVTEAYRSSFRGAALATARAGNVIGGGDWAAERLVPDAIRAAVAGVPLRLRSPDAVRPWQHVLEPLGGYLLLAERLWEDGDAVAEAWNFGPAEDETRTVAWIADAVSRRWKGATAWRREEGAQPHEAHVLRLDCAKARARLGWTPRIDVERALDWTVAWYRAHHGGADVRALTEEQIAAFVAIHESA
jgi:CDP-glucose 4,6-dehydratase